MSEKIKNNLKYPRKCKVCGLGEVEHEYAVCKVCGWEDDEIQYENPDYIGGANDMSFNMYQKFWKENKGILLKEKNPVLAINLANKFFIKNYSDIYEDIMKYRTGEIKQDIK